VFSILRYANKALELAPNDPIIVGYMGNVLFYAPKGIGDKKKALALFEKAATLFESSKWEYCWNRPAMLLAAAQCYEKTGRKNEALSIANDLLNEFPNFTYIRDTYLPALRNAK
jgi:tetratricopeptide (TPR) repeat protein